MKRIETGPLSRDRLTRRHAGNVYPRGVYQGRQDFTGFSLMEVMVVLAISMVLLSALASIFAQSVQSQEQINKDGQKIESARYSLDMMAEDIKLAGYYGVYSPATTGATPADWVYVDPCSTTGGSPLPGWSPTTATVTVPMPIFGYEAHSGGSLPAALTACLDNYKTGTDVLVIRRASTTSLTAGGTGYVAYDPYLQVSSCPEGSVDTQPFVAASTAVTTTFNLHKLGCTTVSPGANADVRKLISRIYYISSCNDCTAADGIPTLKVVELGIPSTGGSTLKVKENVRTIAPGIDNMHMEYGIDTGGDGSIDAYVTSNNDPRQSGTTGTAVTGMRTDTGGENRWEDVMAVKLFLVTRDLDSTRNYTDSKSFVMGTVTAAAAGDAYRRKLMSSTIKLINMAGRREVP